MSYKHSCVINDGGYYQTLVVVYHESDKSGNKKWTPLNYTLKDGETLLDVPPPSSFVCPRWTGTAWIEGATPEEIAAWERDYPAPPPPAPTQEEYQLAAMALTQASQEAAITQLQQANAMLMLQLAQTQPTGGESHV